MIDLGQITGGIADVYRLYLQTRLQEQERALQRQLTQQQITQGQREPLLQQHTILMQQAQQYLVAGQPVPDSLQQQILQVRGQLGFPGAAPPAPSGAAPPAPSVAARSPLDRAPRPKLALPGFPESGLPARPISPPTARPSLFPVPRQPAFRTAGEAAQRLGLKLRQGVDPNLDLATLPEGFDARQLFEAGEADQQRLSAQWRMENYWPKVSEAQIRANPRLLQQFVRDNELLGGRLPTEQRPVTEEVRLPIQRPEEGSLGRALVSPGTQALQIPTGQIQAVPIFPQAQPEVMVNIPGVGEIPLSQLPAGAQTAVINNFFDAATRVGVSVNGRTLFVSPDKALEAALKGRAGAYSIKMPDGAVLSGLTADQYVSAYRAATDARKAAVASIDQGGLTPAEKRVLDNYNKLVDQRTRLLDIASQSFDEGAKNRAIADIAALDQRINQLQPGVDRILLRGQPAPPPVPQGGLSTEALGYIQDARQQNIPLPRVLVWARQNGLDEAAVRRAYGQQAPKAREPVKPGQRPSVLQMATRIRQAAEKGEPFPGSYLRQQGYTQQEINQLRAVYNQYRK